MDSLIFAKMLKKASSLKDCVIAALRMALPPELAQDFIHRIMEKRIVFPSKPSISRHQLSVHATKHG